jgi:hypothetical protein
MARVAVRFGLGTIVATGIVAGIIFAAFEMLAAAMLMGPDATAMPLRMIGAMVLGAQALEPSYSLAVAAMSGVIVHLILSVVFTAIFAAIAAPMLAATGLGATSGSLAFAGIGFGIVLWLVNFYLVAPAAGWTWFPERTDPVVQFLAHAFFFGCATGWMLGRGRPPGIPTL